MLVKQQRYQKTLPLSGLRPAGRVQQALALALALGLAGCAGAERTVVAANTSAPAVSSPASPQAGRTLAAGASQSPEALFASLGATPAMTGKVGAFRTVVPPEAREAVIQAYEAQEKKQWDKLEELLPEARKDPVLGIYAEYWSLHRQLQDPDLPVPDAAMTRFMKAHPEGYLSDRLKGDWIIAATRVGNYQLAAKLGPVVNNNSSEDCSRLLSLHMVGDKVTADQAMNVFQPNVACWRMFGQLAAQGVLKWDHLQEQLHTILETNQKGSAQRLAGMMFDRDQMKQYVALMKNPKKWLSGRKAPRGQAETELVTIALSRLAYGDEREANAKYVESQWAKALPKKDIEWVWSQFGLVAALNAELNAVDWYRKSGNAPLTDYNHAWQVRAELRQPRINWKHVDQAIQRMSKRQASETAWVYWKGRALAAQGNHQAAAERYQSIAGVHDFYGQLATEELGQALSIPSLPAPLTADELKEALENPHLQRAIAMFDQGWRPDAVYEWSYALRGMNDRQLLAAAELARYEHIYDRVVNTSLLTSQEIDFSQRFIAPFEGRVAEKAKLVNLDPAWIYGLIRQESRFITDARSRVGASGLMQLMPATARWVAKKIGMTDFTPSSVNDFDTNTILGTNYLSMVLNDLDGSEILATAGYNAGPRRPIQWRSKFLAPVEGAIFAETIPFTETRLYVKNVMSNTTYYAMMFTGKPQSLKKRLGTVSPSPSKKVDLP